ncbi:hypothetical protein V2J09_002963 [Rumex salicifolius]
MHPRMKLLGRILCVTLVIVYSLGLGGCSYGEEAAENGVALMESAEKEALYTAIQGFVGNWWNGSDLYPNPCGWTPIQGVSCDLFDGFWYVIELNIGPLHDNSLSCGQNVEFRPQLFQLTHLKSLSFFSCFTSLHQPFTIPATTATWDTLGSSLESLEFRSNPGLIGQIPPNFSNLKKLKSLVMLENGLGGQISSNLGSLKGLKRLVLSGNKLTGQIPNTLGYLTELLILDLSRNSLSGSLPFSFGGLDSVLKLDLSSNKLVGGIPKEISNLKSLTLLDLSKNNFTGGLDEIQWWEMDSLEELVLSSNQFGGELKGLDWEKMKKLVALDLSDVGLQGEVPDSIARMQKLSFLDLSNNNLTGKVSPKLASMPNLSTLYLNKNNLDGEIGFPNWFYGKMGSRLGLGGNPKLCSSSASPLGVEPCQSDVTVNDQNQRSKFGGNPDLSLMASWGVQIRCGINGFWLRFLVESLMIVGLIVT